MKASAIFHRLFLFAVLLTGLTAAATAQDTLPPGVLKPELGPNDTIPVPASIHDNMLVPERTLDYVWATAPMPAAVRERIEKWTRLRNAVYVTYPYARKAGAIMNDINARISKMDHGAKKDYIKSREKELKKEFTEPLSNLSVYQGKVLMKLINRQTGNNCYDIIKEYKGGITARVWQTVAFFFSSNLKQPYEAQGDDREMESIVKEVERMYR
jgi:Domain of unknown function (DUF4294)